jgi:hypothetical protein
MPAALIHRLQLMTHATTMPTTMKASMPPIKMMLATSVSDAASSGDIAFLAGGKGPATGGASDLS